MKICYLADIKSEHTQKWCRYFSSKGNEIHVISLRTGEFDGVTVHSLDANNEVWNRKSSFSKFVYIKNIMKLKNLIRSISPDILHAHYGSSYGLLGALVNYHPFIISLWGSDILLFPKEGLIQKNIIKYNLKKADRIFSTSKYMIQEAKLYTSKNVDLTPFGINLNIFKNENNRSFDEIRFGIVKSLERVYGIDYLIKAFGEIIKLYPEKQMTLEILGDGTERENLVNLINELNLNRNVRILGKTSLEGVAKFYNNINIAVFPSISESFGVAVLEAQACGVPVIVSEIKAFEETTIPGKTSLFCKAKDIDSLVKAMDKLIRDDILLKEMSVAGEKFVAEYFDEKDNFNEISSLYDEINKASTI